MGGCNSLLTGLSFCIFTASPPPTHNLYSTYKMEARANLLKHTACHTSLLLKILPWLPILFRVETKVLTVDSQTLYLFILSPIILSFVHHSPSSLACFLSLRHAKKTPVSGLCTCCFLCLYLLHIHKPLSILPQESFFMRPNYPVYNCNPLKMH